MFTEIAIKITHFLYIVTQQTADDLFIKCRRQKKYIGETENSSIIAFYPLELQVMASV
jgi:hypothetical protein